MVGTLVARTDGGLGGFGGSGAVYTYQVDNWVKGDAGDVIEVHSGQGDGDCGMGGQIGDRIGAFLYDGGGFISGNSCDQVDPEALLAAARGPIPSTTGIGRLLSGSGWSSTRLSVLDEVGGTVAQLDAGRGEQWEGTQGLEICPGGALMLQWTQTTVHVWDLATLTATASHPVSGPDGYPVVWDVSCRDPEASSIWVVGASEFENELFDVVDGTVLLSGVVAEWASLGSDYLIAQRGSDAVLIEVGDGAETTIHETPPNENWGVTTSPNPVDDTLALLETRYANDSSSVEATLFVMDRTGEVSQQFEIPAEAYSPIWLDGDRIALRTVDWEDASNSIGYVFDLETGVTHEITGWDADPMAADGDTLFGARGGTIVTAEISSGAMADLVTLPTDFAGPIVVLDDVVVGEPGEPVGSTPVAPVETTPPLVAPEMGVDAPDTTSARWVAGSAIVGFLGILVWLAARRPSRPRS